MTRNYVSPITANLDLSFMNGVILDLDATQNYTMDDGGAGTVAQWVDANGQVFNKFNATGGPLLDPVGANGLPSFRFDGVDDGFVLANSFAQNYQALAGCTVLLVASLPVFPVSSKVAFNIANGLTLASTRMGPGFGANGNTFFGARRRDSDGNFNDLSPTGGFVLNEVAIFGYHFNFTNNSVNSAYAMSKNGVYTYGPQTTSTGSQTHALSAAAGYFGGTTTTGQPSISKGLEVGGQLNSQSYTKVNINRILVVNHNLTPRELAQVATLASAKYGITGNTISDPDNYQMYQVDPVTRLASLPGITGAYSGAPSGIQARVTGITVGGLKYSSTWTTIATSPTGGTYTGTLTNIPQGYYTLQTRQSNDSTITASRFKILVSDIYGEMGQSNATDRVNGFARTLLLRPNVVAAMPTSYNIDARATMPSAVVFNGAQALGRCYEMSGTQSHWAVFAQLYFDTFKVPCGIAAMAVGGSNLTAWQPNSTTLYSSISGNDGFRTDLNYYNRALAGFIAATKGTGIRKIKWHLGESMAGATTVANYVTLFNNVATQLATDLPGVKIMPCKLQQCVTQTGFQYDFSAVNQAIDILWNQGGNVAKGPDFSNLLSDIDPIPSNGRVHLLSASNQLAQGRGWAAAIAADEAWPVAA
jgi:hypothetical protein